MEMLTLKSPKEEAMELVDKCRTEIYKGQLTTADVNPKRDAYRDEQGRRCAIAMVYEFLPFVNVRDLDTYKYWHQVYSELEKMAIKL